MTEKKKILLHTCCAPDATHVINVLKENYEPVIFFYNPSVFPDDEYFLRLSEAEKLSKSTGIEFLRGNFSPEKWYELVTGLEDEPEGGARCEVCFRMRLEETARQAKENSINIFTTTLTISPHKNSPLINRLGKDAALKYGIEFLESDFKKKEGFKKSIELSKKYGLYRQNYCGCAFSIRK